MRGWAHESLAAPSPPSPAPAESGALAVLGKRPQRSGSVSPAQRLLHSPKSPYATGHADDESSPPVLTVLARLLEETVGANEREGDGGSPSLFCGVRAPAVPLAAYMARIFRYANCSASCYVLAFVYLERLMKSDPRLRITSLSVHRLLSTALMVAAKFIDDSYYNNAYWARVAGISLAEMNALELELLQSIDYRLHVQPEEFDLVCERLAARLTPAELEAAEAACVADAGWASPTEGQVEA